MFQVWARFRGWSSDHPFLLALIVLLAVVIPGFIRMESIASGAETTALKSEKASDDATKAVEAVEDQADRNTEIVGCLVTYATDMTDALQDRDAVVKTARAAQKETWKTFLRLIRDPTPPADARDTMIESILRYVEILNRLDRNDSINPYPHLSNCLLDGGDAEAAFQAASYTGGGPTCFGLRVTVAGGPGNDTLIGTDGSDVIRGFRGRDLIYSGRGNDTLCGGKGDDTINGGQGRDRARGNRGSDFCVLVEERHGC
jgi:Ca2+-binding RTX toxin-like protein